MAVRHSLSTKSRQLTHQRHSMKLEEIIKMKEAFQEKIEAEGEAAVKTFLKEWFDQHPEYYGIKWAQYTPYFNDGDTCVFRIQCIEGFRTKEEFEDAVPGDGKGHDFEYGPDAEDGKDLTEAFNAIEDLLETVFGDHAKVEVTREKIEVTEYEHD